jgi:molybdate-binding protein
MDDFREIQDISVIKLLSDERRLGIIRRLMRAPNTLSQLGEQLGMSAARVRHHLKLLEAAGMVELDHTRPAGGFIEKYYRASAGAFFFHRAILPHAAKGGTLTVIGSHDPALELLAADLSHDALLPELRPIPVGSLDGLIALKQGLCKIAGCHLYEPLSGTYNVSFVRHLFPGLAMEMVTLTHREQGFIVSPGNPKRIEGLNDLPRADLMFVNRRAGSGTRLWLDWQIREHGFDPALINGYANEVNTHAEVAQAIASGQADLGLAVSAAARASGLAFIPLFEERFDLILSGASLADPLVVRLLDAIASAPVRNRIASLAGYRTSETGNHTHVM